MESLSSFVKRRDVAGSSFSSVSLTSGLGLSSSVVKSRPGVVRTPLQERSLAKMCPPDSGKTTTSQSNRAAGKFNLKASLQRSLSYKPHLGPLKPMDSSNLQTCSTVCGSFAKTFAQQSTLANNRELRIASTSKSTIY